MLRRKQLELGDERVVVSESELGVDPLLERCEPELLEALDLVRAKDSYARSASAAPRQSASSLTKGSAASVGPPPRSLAGPPRAGARSG